MPNMLRIRNEIRLITWGLINKEMRLEIAEKEKTVNFQACNEKKNTLKDADFQMANSPFYLRKLMYKWNNLMNMRKLQWCKNILQLFYRSLRLWIYYIVFTIAITYIHIFKKANS